MKFSLPGQLKGPECRRVVAQAVTLRRQLEPIFNEIQSDAVRELAIILRVDGSLGSFGSEAIENIGFSAKTLTCDVVIRDFGWNDIDDAEIAELLKSRVHQAIIGCFRYMDIKTDMSRINEVLK